MTDWTALTTPAIIALVPLIVAAVKRWAPTRYTVLWPALATALGPLLDVASTYLTAQPASPGRGILLGMAGVALREVVDQLRKTKMGP